MPKARVALPALGLVAIGVALAGWAIAGRSRPDADLPQPPHFVEEAQAAGVEHAYRGDFMYFVGGGVATFDCDGDGRQDLFLAGGSGPAALYHNDSVQAGPLKFHRVSSAATDLDDVTGAYPLDLDGDGITDLAVLRVGENVLLRGLGDCRFQRANEALGFDGGDAWSTAFSATWEGTAKLPTLAVGNYLELDSVGSSAYRCADGQLFRPDASGARYAAPIPLSPGYCALSMLFSDWDRSGERDLRVSNDRHYYGETSDGGEQLWHIKRANPPRPYTAAEGWQPLRIWGMGIASYDLTGDGRPEVFLTSQGDNKLQTLADAAGRPTYRDIALARGVTATRPYAGDVRLPSTAWHAEFQDVNNDGQMDLFVSKGNVDAMPDFAMRDPNDLFLGTPDGTFVEAAGPAGLTSFGKSRGAAFADLNLDGLLDLVVVNREQNVQIWRNVGNGTAASPAPMAGWIGLRLQQPGSNRNAIGAWIDVTAAGRTMRRELTIGGGHASGELGWIHIGIGQAQDAEVRVTWPDGSTEGPMRVGADTWNVIERGSRTVTPWTF